MIRFFPNMITHQKNVCKKVFCITIFLSALYFISGGIPLKFSAVFNSNKTVPVESNSSDHSVYSATTQKRAFSDSIESMNSKEQLKSIKHAEKNIDIDTSRVQLATTEYGPTGLFEAYVAHDDPFEFIENAIDDIIGTLESNPHEIDKLLQRDWSDKEHLYALLVNLEEHGNEFIIQSIRDVALEYTNSLNSVERTNSLSFLSFVGGVDDHTVRRRLLDIGWSDATDEAQKAITQNMFSTTVPPEEQIEVVAMLNEMAMFSKDSMVRSTAFYQLDNWGISDQEFQNTASELLKDDNQSVRVAVVSALGSRNLNTGSRAMLLALAEDTEENSTVRIAAAGVLKKTELTEYEYELINKLLESGG